MLCTDGLWAQITDKELLSVAGDKAPAAACKELVEIAKNRGGPDNITVQILKIVEVDHGAVAFETGRCRR